MSVPIRVSIPAIRLRRAPRGFHAGAWALLAVLLAVLTAVSGCKKTQRRTVSQDGVTQALAVVNNEPITFEDYQARYQLLLTRWDRFIGNDPGRKLEIKELVLGRMVDEKLMEQEARRKGIQVDESELNARLLDLVSGTEESGKTSGPLLPENLQAQWTQELRRRMVFEKLIRQEVINRIRVTPVEMHTYYEQNRQSFHLPERVKARHIAVGSRALYNKVMRLLDNRADFGELVNKYSITPDRLAGGELGYVERGVLPPEFDDALFKMTRVGSISPERDPVQTQMGFHIFLLEGREPEETLDFRDAIPEIKRRLVREKETDAYRRWLKELHSKASVTIDQQMLMAE